MLLFTHKEFHLNIIQVYLQGGQSMFQDRVAPGDSFQSERTGSGGTSRILFRPEKPEECRKGH